MATARISIRRILITFVLVGFAVAGSFTSGAAADPAYTVHSITPWKQNAAPVGWSSSLNRVIYNSIGSDGMFNAYSANPDGSDPECLTCTIPSYPGVGTATNRGASDVSPNGQYMLVTVEEGAHGGQIGGRWTQPGYGGANNVWLFTTDGQHAWPLTDISSRSQSALGVIWPRFDRTGNEIVWSSMYAPAIANLGYWRLKVASIAWAGGVPSLANVQTIEPATNAFYEPYGFTPDDQHIIFASSEGQSSFANDQIDTIATDGTGLTQLTHPNPGTVVNYNEFAWYTPDNSELIYGGTLNTTSGGMDYWTMNPDGSDPQQLTYFNQPWNTESEGYSIVEGLAFNPNDPDQFIASVAADSASQNINAYTVDLDAPSTGGLTEQFYSGQNFGQLISTTTQNPSDGFDTNGSPAAGVPATQYSIRWSGTLTVPTTGTYTFCVVADSGARLVLGGQQLIYSYDLVGRRVCATAAETANSSISIELDYQHGVGPAKAQLSWILPGASTPSLIPGTALAPSPSTTTTTSPPATSSSSAPTSAPTAGDGAKTAAVGTTPPARGTTKPSKSTPPSKIKRKSSQRAAQRKRAQARRRAHARAARTRSRHQSVRHHSAP